ncbi:MAG: hypothetical protein ABJP48_01255 [Erythrobacter sp.]
MSQEFVKYSVRVNSPIPFVFVFLALVLAYVVPLQNAAQIGLLGVGAGAIGAFASRSFVTRSFEPADASIAARRRVVAIFGLLRLGIGLFILAIGVLPLAIWLKPIFLALGGYLVGSTAAVPLQRDQLV